jgi:hypothetical protein
VGVLALLGGCELWVRSHEALFRAATHRALAKAALLDRQGPIDVLFVGTSRTQDGVSPRIFSQRLAAIGVAAPVRAFNVAFTSSSLETLEYLAGRYAGREGLKLVALELSVPQLKNETPPWEDPSRPPGTWEDGLFEALEKHIRLVAHRKALLGENLIRLPGLVFFPHKLDGSEVMLTDQLRQALDWRSDSRTPDEAESWRPSVVLPASIPGGTVESQWVPRMAKIARSFTDRRTRVVFVVPPLATADASAEERAPMMKKMFADLATASESEVWDFSEQTHGDDFFRGATHLNERGRSAFSRALAERAVVAGFFPLSRLAKP